MSYVDNNSAHLPISHHNVSTVQNVLIYKDAYWKLDSQIWAQLIHCTIEFIHKTITFECHAEIMEFVSEKEFEEEN